MSISLAVDVSTSGIVFTSTTPLSIQDQLPEQPLQNMLVDANVEEDEWDNTDYPPPEDSIPYTTSASHTPAKPPQQLSQSIVRATGDVYPPICQPKEKYQVPLSYIDKEDVREALVGSHVLEDWLYSALDQVAPAEDGELRAICPWHDDHNPSLSINVQKGKCYCFSCNEGGDIFSLRMKVEDVDFVESVRRFVDDLADADADDEGRPRPARTSSRPPKVLPPATLLDIEFHAGLLANKAFDRAWFVQHRGVSEDTLVLYRMGMPEHHYDCQPYVFPIIHSNGLPVGIKMASWKYGGDGKYARDRQYLTHGEHGLFGAHLLSKYPDAMVVLCEGEPDAMVCHQAFQEGDVVAISSTQGAGTWKPAWSEQLRGRRVIIVYDSDTAGRSGALDVARALFGVASEVRVCALWPENDGTDKDKKDITDWIVRHKLPVADFVSLVVNTPVWEPAPHLAEEYSSKSDERPLVSKEDKKATLTPLPKEVAKRKKKDDLQVVRREVVPLEHEKTIPLTDAQQRELAVVEALNAEGWAQVNIRGTLVIVNPNHPEYGHLSEKAFLAILRKHRVQVQETFSDGSTRIRSIAAAKIWLASDDRKVYKHVVYEPAGAPEDVLNLWRGLPETPQYVLDDLAAEGLAMSISYDLFIQSSARWAPRVVDHYRSSLNLVNPIDQNYWWGWQAHGLQRPWEIPTVAVVLQGKSGTGKNTTSDIMCLLVGEWNHKLVDNAEQVVGRFTGFISDALFVTADEAFFAGDRADARHLKALISNPKRAVEEKFEKTIEVRNCLRLVILTNDIHAINVDIHDRRYFVLSVQDIHLQDYDYFDKLYAALPIEIPYLRELLRRLDISEFNVRKRPRTEGLLQQIRQSLDPIESFLEDLVSRRRVIEYADLNDTPKRYDGKWHRKDDAPSSEGGSVVVMHPTWFLNLDLMDSKWYFIGGAVLYAAFCEFCRLARVHHSYLPEAFGRKLKEYGIPNTKHRANGCQWSYDFSEYAGEQGYHSIVDYLQQRGKCGK
jgi:DNA primase